MKQAGSRKQLILRVVVTLALLGFLGYQMDLGQFWSVLFSANWSLVFLAALLHFATVFQSVGRWGLILANFAIVTPFGKLTQITLIGYFFNLFLPSAVGGDFFRSYYLAKREQRGMSTTLTTTFLDRVAGLSALLMIALPAVLIYPIRVQGFSLVPIFLGIWLIFIACIVALFNPWMHSKMRLLLERFHRPEIEQKMTLVAQGLDRLRRNGKAIAGVIVLSIGIQFFVILAMWVAALSIGIDAPFFIFLIFIPIVNLAVAIPITINGVGLRESVYYLLFAELGVPMETSVALSILNLVIVAATSLPGGVVYSFYKKEID